MKSCSIFTALSSWLGQLDVDSEMIPQEIYVVRLSTFSNLLMTWNKLRHGQLFLLVIIIIYYVYSQTDYCCSTLCASFCLSIQVAKTVILTQQGLSFFLIKFRCEICFKPVASNNHAIKCGKCDLWIHIKCHKINKQT